MLGGVKAEFLAEPNSAEAGDIRNLISHNDSRVPLDQREAWIRELTAVGREYLKIQKATAKARTERAGMIRAAKSKLPAGVEKERTIYGVVYPALSSDMIRATTLLGIDGLNKMMNSGLSTELMQ
jgi:hypothetical protein